MEALKNSASDPTAVLQLPNNISSQTTHKTLHLMETILATPSKQATAQSLDELLSSSLIDLHSNFIKPPICLQKVEDDGFSTLATLGNISMVIGKAKSGKTFWISSLMAALVKNNHEVNCLKACLPPEKEVCLYFDTEQSDYHAQKTALRVLKIAGVTEHVNFRAYGLRGHSAQVRLELIEHAIRKIGNVGFVVIDGIRDLIKTTNDEAESVALSGLLLKLSQEYGIHIMCVLHRNKTDDNARGHIGTEMLNKAEIVISVTKPSKKLSLFKVDTELSRNEAFKPFDFVIDAQGLVQIDCSQQNVREQKRAVFNPDSMDSEQHRELVESIFSNRARFRYSELKDEITTALLKQGEDLSETKARELHQFYLKNSFIKQHGKPKTVACYYTLP